MFCSSETRKQMFSPGNKSHPVVGIGSRRDLISLGSSNRFRDIFPEWNEKFQYVPRHPHGFVIVEDEKRCPCDGGEDEPRDLVA